MNHLFFPLDSISPDIVERYHERAIEEADPKSNAYYTQLFEASQFSKYTRQYYQEIWKNKSYSQIHLPNDLPFLIFLYKAQSDRYHSLLHRKNIDINGNRDNYTFKDLVRFYLECLSVVY